MKNKIYILILYFSFTFFIFAQEPNTIVITEDGNTLEKTEIGNPEIQDKKIEKLFRKFDEKIVKTGILTDKFSMSNKIDHYSYNLDSIRIVKKHEFQDIYHGLLKSHVSHSKMLKSEIKDNLLHNYLINEKVVPIPLLICNFNKIKSSALQDNLITIENEEFTFNNIEPDDILDLKELFLATSWKKEIYNGSEVVFALEEQFYFSNIKKKIDKIEIDFEDGLGYRETSLNSKLTVNYNSTGIKTVKVKIEYSDNSSYESYFEQNIVMLSTPTPNATWQLVADIPYYGQYALGEAYVWQGGILDKPVIVVEGFDLDEDTGKDELYALLNQQDLLETLRTWGYDFIVLNFNNSKDYIQRNAYLISKLINRVNLEKSGGEQLVLIGASMGGLVSRYALTYMESKNMAHNVRNFISFDAPQNGANIPLGDQYWLNFFASESGAAQDNLNKINSVAAKQMLSYHHSAFPFTSSYRTNLMTEINNMGSYPSNLRKVAYSNGSGSGSGLQLVDSYRLVYWRHRDFWVDIDGHTWAVPNGFSRKIFQGMVDVFGPSYRSQNITVTTSFSYDDSPGGKRSTNQTIVDEIPNGYTPTKYTNNPDHAFIPMISALDLNTTNLFYNAASDPNILQKTPFDAVYYPNSNEPHIFISHSTKMNMLNEITNFNIPQLEVSISGPSVLYGQIPSSSESEVDDGLIVNRPGHEATGTWTANATGGVSGYTYQWYQQSGSVWYTLYSETNKSMTRTISSDKTFKVIVTSAGETASATKFVDFIIDIDPFALLDNYPNPFNPITKIRFNLPTTGIVKLKIYNILGQQVITLNDRILDAGLHEIEWNGKNNYGVQVASGVYLYSLEYQNKRVIKKMLFAK